MAVCPACGARSEGAERCPSCGAPLAAAGWRVRIGENDEATDLDTLQAWARESKLQGAHQVFHPGQNAWLTASAIQELQQDLAAEGQGAGAGKSRTGWTLGALGVLLVALDLVITGTWVLGALGVLLVLAGLVASLRTT